MTPAYYQFPTCQVSDISLHLTPAAAQAVQCLARSSRLDGRNKSDRVDGRIEDLRKAQTFIEMEIDRLQPDPDPEPAEESDPDAFLAFDAALDDLAATPVPLLPPAQLAAALSILDMLRGEA